MNMSSYILAITIMVLVVSPLIIPTAITVVDALANLRTKRRVGKDAFPAGTAVVVGRRAVDA